MPKQRKLRPERPGLGRHDKTGPRSPENFPLFTEEAIALKLLENCCNRNPANCPLGDRQICEDFYEALWSKYRHYDIELADLPKLVARWLEGL